MGLLDSLDCKYLRRYAFRCIPWLSKLSLVARINSSNEKLVTRDRALRVFWRVLHCENNFLPLEVVALDVCRLTTALVDGIAANIVLGYTKSFCNHSQLDFRNCLFVYLAFIHFYFNLEANFFKIIFNFLEFSGEI